MSRPPDYMNDVSERLSEVMDDIGVNERQVMKRQRAMLLLQNIYTIIFNQEDQEEMTNFIFGSKIEGSTTLGLNSDLDLLWTLDTFVIQNMSERKPEVVNWLMIQNENISPGYCYLQCIKPDLPLPGNVNDTDSRMMEHCVTDSEGRLLLKNICLKRTYPDSPQCNILQEKLHGPAFTIHGVPGGTDMVSSFYCKSSPHQVTSWLQKQRGCKWPTEEDLEKCRHSGCFVVPVGGKVSYVPTLEWRISTSLQERYLMFSLNITQLRCYVLMKMILKTHIDPHVEDVLSSFMCKNVLLYCIGNSSHDWRTGNLLSYFHLCLFMLKECVVQRNCPHLMIPENNLLAERLTDKQRGEIQDIINNLMEKDEQFLYEIQIDDLGRRLKMKLNMISPCPDIAPATGISHKISREFVLRTVAMLTKYLPYGLEKIKHESIENALPHSFLELKNLERHRRDYNLQTASELPIPLVSSTLGLVIASLNIDSNTAISDQAFTYLEVGKEFDALSGRLKLVSVLYCTGDMERAERELRISQKHYKLLLSHTTCNDGSTCKCNDGSACKCNDGSACKCNDGSACKCNDGSACKCNDGSACKCYAKARSHRRIDIDKARDDYDEAAIKSHQLLIPIVLHCEILCVPHELRNELLKSYTTEDRKIGTLEESMWMDLITVEPVPYLYFLQYKTYGQLQRRTEQLEALSNLVLSFKNEPILPYRDTSFNLLGQLFEQENKQPIACQCYIGSLQNCLRNNAARFLLCIQLFKQWKQDNTL